MLISRAALEPIPLYPSAPPPPPRAVLPALWIVNVVPSAPPPVTSEYLNEAVNAPFPVPIDPIWNGVLNHADRARLPLLVVIVSTSPAIVGRELFAPWRFHPDPFP